jgi:hypothetical protein
VTGPRHTRRSGGAPVAVTDDEHGRATPETPRVRALTPDETRAWADIATDDEHYCEHVKDFRRAWIGAAAVAYGQHLAGAAGPTNEREAAYRAFVDELTTAWKDENPEFGNALYMAFVMERTSTASDPPLKDYLERTSTEPDPTGPLKDYLASDKPMSLGNRVGLVTFIERLEQRIASLEERIASMQKRGRPQRKSYPWNATDAERNAALLVARWQAEWRKEHGRKRVPPAETEKMISRAIAEAATAFGVRATSIGKDRIRIALKAGRI